MIPVVTVSIIVEGAELSQYENETLKKALSVQVLAVLPLCTCEVLSDAMSNQSSVVSPYRSLTICQPVIRMQSESRLFGKVVIDG